MVAITERYIEQSTDEQWWAHSRTQGWVVLDRSAVCNRTATLPEFMKFTRCSDGESYEQADHAWDYTEAQQYLDSLPYEEASEAEAVLIRMQEQFVAA